MAPTKSRERVLSDDEIKEIWTATDMLVSIFCPFVKLLLLTGQRRNEVASMEWAEVDLEKGIWIVPAHRAKNGLPNDVPLCPAAINILTAIPRLGAYVFTSDGKTHISGYSRFKQSLDSAIAVAREQVARNPDEKSPVMKAMSSWTFHDFRRTVSTNLAKLEVRREVTERLLNHTSGAISGVAKIYNRYDYWRERQNAVEAWCLKIGMILGSEPEQTGQ